MMNSDDAAKIKIGGIEFPVALLDALRERRLVVFAGAGVSMGEPSSLPNYEKLADMIAEGTGEKRGKNEPPDRFLGKLSDDGVKVHARAKRILSKDNLKHTELHESLLRLFKREDDVRIVTTNFDMLFKEAAIPVFETVPNIYDSHAQLPGSNFNGIVHVHGSVRMANEMVLTDRDFGNAYLKDSSKADQKEDWARQFLTNLFEKYTILFVGYSHGDTILTYLALALPPTDQKRFVLIPDDSETEHWDRLKIDRIPYSASADHKALHKGVQKFADFINWHPSNWKEKMKRITEKSPDNLGDDQNLLQYALRKKKNVEFFTDATESADWLDWIDKQGYLDGIYDERSRDERNGLWARWLIEKFAVSHADRLQYVIGRREGRLPAYFWETLANTVQSGDLNDQDFGQWATLLISRVPEKMDSYHLCSLCKFCSERSLMAAAAQIFDLMLTTHPIIKNDMKDMQSLNLESTPELDFNRLKLQPMYNLQHVIVSWEGSLRPLIGHLAELLIDPVIRRLEERHRILSAWKESNRNYDSVLVGYTPIESLSPGSISVDAGINLMICAARDSLGWIVENRREDGTYWRSRLENSESPVLRCLAAHSVRMDANLSSDEKAAWLLETNLLLEVKRINDSAPHQELYKLAEQIYPRLNDERRRAMIEAIEEYQFLRQDRESDEKIEERHRYDWYHILHRSDPECPLAGQAFEEAQCNHPEWRPRTDMGIQITYGSPSSLSPEQLLARKGSEWVPELPVLFSHVAERPRINDSVRGLSEAVRKAAKQDFDWGLTLAEGLANANEWETDAWLGLIEAWSHGENMAGTDLDKDRYEKVLKWIANENLHGKEERDYFIIWTLNSLVVNGGAPYALELLSDTNRIAASFWDKIDEHDAELPEPAPFIDNRPAARLANYWLDGLLLLLRDTDSEPEGLEKDWAEALSKIARDSSANGRIGRSTLAQRFALLLYVDEEWTKEKLLPSFSSPDDDEFRSVWIGFLFRMHLTEETAEILDKPSLKAIDRILRDSELSGRFIEYYVQMAVRSIDNPLKIWFPEFFKRSSEENRHEFTHRLDSLIRLSYLREQEDDLCGVWNRWLKRYWENRLDGVPKPLDNEEIEKMFSWPIYFGSAFPEAVELARRMKPDEPVGTDFIYWLSKSGLWSKYPDAAAEMLLYLGEISSLWFGSGTGKELIDNLLDLNLPDNLKRDLENLRATLS